jgi:hypothetical protein
MKKILAIAAVLMLLVPMAYALESIEDMDLDNVTGQAGISLYNYNGAMTINASLEGISWGDPDGYSASGTPAAGFIKIQALVNTTTAGTIGIGITQAVGNEVKIEVDDDGIFVDSGTTGITVTPPAMLRISVQAGYSALWGSANIASESVTLGDLGLGALSVTVNTPQVLRIAPIP